MIALLLSVLLAAYLLVPYACFRLLLGRFVPVRIFQEHRMEELIRAGATVGVLFIVSLMAVWYLPFCKRHPFSFPDTPTLRVADYITVADGLYSEELFKRDPDKFWGALSRVAKRQGRFAAWYYSFVVSWAFVVGLASRYYGKLWRIKWCSPVADFLVLPHISPWYSILSAFTFPEPKKTMVRADVLMTDGTLYRGIVARYFLDNDGNLAGIFLEDPARYDRRALLRERDLWGTTRPSNAYLKRIPSTRLYLVADKIVNLNLNYEPPTAIAGIVEKYLTELVPGPISVSVSSEESPTRQ